MTTATLALTDSTTMLRRNLRRMIRYPSMTVIILGTPVIFLLLFVYVFGGTLGAGISGVPGDRAAYASYVAPGVILLTIAAVAQSTTISVTMDMTEGIIARFRTMAIWRPSVLAGHVLGGVIQSVLATAVVILVAWAIGFRPNADAVAWLGALGIVVALAFALSWLSVALGLVSKSVETASNLPMFLLLLPFLGSGFVPTESMPTAMAWFAEHQPFTPATEALRSLLLGTPMDGAGVTTMIWCVAITAVGYLWARRLYRTRPIVHS